jgi:hypothetical protein
VQLVWNRHRIVGNKLLQLVWNKLIMDKWGLRYSNSCVKESVDSGEHFSYCNYLWKSHGIVVIKTLQLLWNSHGIVGNKILQLVRLLYSN